MLPSSSESEQRKVTSAPSLMERDLYCLRCAGFLIIRDFINPAVLDVLVRKAREFETEVLDFVEQGGRVDLRHNWPLQTTRCLYTVSTEVQDLAMHPYVQGLVRGYLARPILRDCVLQTNMPDEANRTLGADGDVSYHRDCLWPDEGVGRMYLHVFLLLTDFKADTGATIVVPGTHNHREPGYYFKHSDPRTSRPGVDYKVYERRYFGSAVPLEAPRGSLILLDPMTIHSQGINISSEHRSLVNIAFRAFCIDPQPRLLNARGVAEKHSRVPVRADFLEMLEDDPSLPDYFGPLH